jgi:hypothetical protein
LDRIVVKGDLSSMYGQVLDLRTLLAMEPIEVKRATARQ